MDKCDTCKNRPTMSYSSSPCNSCVDGNLYCSVLEQTMVNPNTAFKNRRYTNPMSGFKYLLFMDTHSVKLICQGCGWTTDYTILANSRFYYTTIECELCAGNDWGWIILDKKEGRA